MTIRIVVINYRLAITAPGIGVGNENMNFVLILDYLST